MKHSHDLLTVVNLIDHAIITNPDLPPLHPSSARSGNASVAITAAPVTRNSPA
jgi:hypothetical protein